MDQRNMTTENTIHIDNEQTAINFFENNPHTEALSSCLQKSPIKYIQFSKSLFQSKKFAFHALKNGWYIDSYMCFLTNNTIFHDENLLYEIFQTIQNHPERFPKDCKSRLYKHIPYYITQREPLKSKVNTLFPNSKPIMNKPALYLYPPQEILDPELEKRIAYEPEADE